VEMARALQPRMKGERSFIHQEENLQKQFCQPEA